MRLPLIISLRKELKGSLPEIAGGGSIAVATQSGVELNAQQQTPARSATLYVFQLVRKAFWLAMLYPAMTVGQLGNRQVGRSPYTFRTQRCQYLKTHTIAQYPQLLNPHNVRRIADVGARPPDYLDGSIACCQGSSPQSRRRRPLRRSVLKLRAASIFRSHARVSKSAESAARFVPGL